MEQTNKKIAVITGASRGIGLATVEKFVAEGFDVIACSSKDDSVVRNKYKGIEFKYGGSIHPVFFDLSNEESTKQGIKEIRSFAKVINVLVNNAGIAKLSFFAFTRIEDIKHLFEINFFAQLKIIQGMLNMLSKSHNASIINLASVAGIDGGIGALAYGASKAAIINATKVLAEELSSFKIRVNAVAPGIINTEMRTTLGDKAVNGMQNQSFMKRLGDPKEVANVIYWLSTDEASYVNGQIIRIDGGM